MAGGWAICPFRRGVASSETELICFPRVGSLPSSEAESARFPEDWFATLERSGGAGSCRGPRRGALERGGDCPAGLRGVRMGRTVYLGHGLGFFESFPFLQIGRRLLAFVDLFA